MEIKQSEVVTMALVDAYIKVKMEVQQLQKELAESKSQVALLTAKLSESLNSKVSMGTQKEKKKKESLPDDSI